MTPHPRSQTFYWKCDRPAAFHGTDERRRDQTGLERPLAEVLREAFPGSVVEVAPTPSQGNHLTFIAKIDGVERFVRVDDGPDRDDYLEVESRILTEVRRVGVAAPCVYAVDASRRRVPFAWHVLDKVDCGDLNGLFKQGGLDLPRVARQIGEAVAGWQTLRSDGFGPFDPVHLRTTGELRGFHRTYADYFHLHLERHLSFLTDRSFLSRDEADAMRRAIDEHAGLLDLAPGCLVHKDLALWNILGTSTDVVAYIDWDDAIAGDALDDLSLLGCFHDAPTLARAVEGYESVRPLPTEPRRRFWLHLLRNLIMKSVIRVGAGYFDRSDGFFLIGTGGSGADLRAFTRNRLATALDGLRSDAPLDRL